MTTRLDDQWERWYSALRAANPDAYRKAISYSESVTINNNTPLKAAADYERSMVMLACELLDVRPS